MIQLRENFSGHGRKKLSAQIDDLTGAGAVYSASSFVYSERRLAVRKHMSLSVRDSLRPTACGTCGKCCIPDSVELFMFESRSTLAFMKNTIRLYARSKCEESWTKEERRKIRMGITLTGKLSVSNCLPCPHKVSPGGVCVLLVSPDRQVGHDKIGTGAVTPSVISSNSGWFKRF
ncbi:hypothetical protein RRG08_048536 [Elysia crispata]|uniref:Uncharacterized protein n=1 Tax=Elysia crispata TaxID=231223 RepID=A0AAE1B6X7_9GAST|nr:hypothetical protein RRG08_048536 [Elysia crispata]